MLCRRCGKREAEVYYKYTVNGNSKEYALCSACAEEMKKKGELDIKMPSLFGDPGNGYFGNLFGLNDFLGFPHSHSAAVAQSKKKCTLCSSTFDELVKSGKIGCAECYKVFADELKLSIEKIHGKEKYMGKRPKRFKEKESKQEKIKALKAEMKAAVKSQEFEQAAILRDKIRALEEGE